MNFLNTFVALVHLFIFLYILFMKNAFLRPYAIQICSTNFVSFEVAYCKLNTTKIIGFVPLHSTSAFLRIIISTVSSYSACKIF